MRYALLLMAALPWVAVAGLCVAMQGLAPAELAFACVSAAAAVAWRCGEGVMERFLAAFGR